MKHSLQRTAGNKMHITIVGAGNVGLQFAAHCAEKGHLVKVYTKKKVGPCVKVINENGDVIHEAKHVEACPDPLLAFGTADLVFVTYPAFMMAQIADEICPFASGKMKICLVPGTGGGEFAFQNCLSKGATVFGLQRVPSVVRTIESRKVVRAVGYRDALHVGALPYEKTKGCAALIESIFSMPVHELSNYLSLTLTPSNPILHTSRLYSLFRDYRPGLIYPRVSLFYEDWDDFTSRLLFEMDDEVQALCRSLPFDLSAVRSLRLHYESPTPEQLTAKIRSIKGFHGLLTPMVQKGNGFEPDFSSRYFTSDFNFGLALLLQFAVLSGSKCEKMKMVYSWYSSFCSFPKTFSLSDYGIDSVDKLVAFYSR